MKRIRQNRAGVERKIREGWKNAQRLSREIDAYRKEHGLSEYQRPPELASMDAVMRRYISLAVELEETGVVPWLDSYGIGNKVDAVEDIDDVEVVARRVYDKYASKYAGTDGRVIELRVASKGSNHIRYTFAFLHRETVQKVIDQLTDELAKWDDEWTGEPHPGFRGGET